MVECSKVIVKLSDRQLKQLKTAVTRKTGITLRMSSKIFDELICLMNYYWQQDKKS